jgi:hypothetical protein
MNTPCFDEAIRFYCGIGEKHYNHHPVVTGPYACVAPVSGSEVKKVNSVAVPEGVHAFQDSGAFNDACYPHPDLDRWYPLDRWQRTTWQQPKSSTVTTEVQFAIEMHLCNYATPAPAILPLSLWNEESEEKPHGK